MINFGRRALGFVARKLIAFHNDLDKKEKENLSQQRDKEWNSKFNSDNYFDYSLTDKLLIRLYKDSILSRYIHDGFERDEVEFVQRFLKKGDVFLDIGANIGLFSLIAADIVGQDGRVYAFEPSPKTFQRLGENIVLNSINNVVPINIGLSDQDGNLTLNISEDGHDAWNSFAKIEQEMYQSEAKVRVKKLDDVINEFKLDKVDLVKIDVEGWEKFVFLGGEEFIKKQSPVIMIEFTEANTFAAGYLVQELYDILERWGYTWYRYIDKKMVLETKKLHYPYDNLFAVKSSYQIESFL